MDFVECGCWIREIWVHKKEHGWFTHARQNNEWHKIEHGPYSLYFLCRLVFAFLITLSLHTVFLISPVSRRNKEIIIIAIGGGGLDLEWMCTGLAFYSRFLFLPSLSLLDYLASCSVHFFGENDYLSSVSIGDEKRTIKWMKAIESKIPV